MLNERKRDFGKSVRNGSAFVLLLVVIGLVITISIVKVARKKALKDPDVCLDLEPWKEWRLREGDKPADKPYEEQADISSRLVYSARVNEDGEGRGDIKVLFIGADGSVRGAWSGDYWKSSLNYDIQGGGFEGYICPDKIYKDQNGEDPSKLFFIAKGGFMFHESDLKKKYRIRTGDIYVTGWLGADYAASGKLTITSDEKYSETYVWEAARPIEFDKMIR